MPLGAGAPSFPPSPFPPPTPPKKKTKKKTLPEFPTLHCQSLVNGDVTNTDFFFNEYLLNGLNP